jgi:mRNA deadenylase 3'-5' endonuclease subunit Ccr4
MKILSWNILADEFIEPTYYPMVKVSLLKNRQERLINIINKIIKYNADIIMLQEVMKEEYTIIKKVFSKKYFISNLYPILWSSEKVHSESGNITLIKKKLSSKVNFDIFSKEIPFVIGRFIYNKSEIVIVNIHLDDSSKKNRLIQIKEIVSHISNDSNVIIGGDFNEPYSNQNKIYLYLKKHLFEPSIIKNSTYFIEESMLIDNIMYKNFNFIKSQVRNKCGGRTINNINCQFKTYGSDHFPTIVYLDVE